MIFRGSTIIAKICIRVFSEGKMTILAEIVWKSCHFGRVMCKDRKKLMGHLSQWKRQYKWRRMNTGHKINMPKHHSIITNNISKIITGIWAGTIPMRCSKRQNHNRRLTSQPRNTTCPPHFTRRNNMILHQKTINNKRTTGRQNKVKAGSMAYKVRPNYKHF